MAVSNVLRTGSIDCFNSRGELIDCHGSGQDAEFSDIPRWPEPRFEALEDNLIVDQLTQLVWPRNGCLAQDILNWQEGLEWLDEINQRALFGLNDWRLPNRRELRSLIDHSRKEPALPGDHLFENVANDWYWTSTTAAVNPRYAWYLHMGGGRMFYGNKSEYHWVWPVSGENSRIPRTGVELCFDQNGDTMPCRDGSGQDGAILSGVKWPEPRFVVVSGGILDTLTGLIWHPDGQLVDTPVCWSEALKSVEIHSLNTGQPYRLPTINELESLVDASHHSPALPARHPFTDLREAYWSSTTSGYETDWAYVLYLQKGAVGVGYKTNNDFHVWPVMTQNDSAV